MVSLQPMSEKEFALFLERAIPTYAAEKVKSGAWDPADALERSRAEHAALLPQGVATPGHYLYTVRQKDCGPAVGDIWLAVDQGAPVRAGFIYDLFIEDPYRRQGLASQAMLALETEARTLGLGSLALHVFGHNVGARALYEKLGYKITDLNMTKPLGTGRAA